MWLDLQINVVKEEALLTNGFFFRVVSKNEISEVSILRFIDNQNHFLRMFAKFIFQT